MKENEVRFSDYEVIDAKDIPYVPKRQMWDILFTDASNKLLVGKALKITDLKAGNRMQACLWLKHRRGLYKDLVIRKRGQAYYMIKEAKP